MNEIHLGGMVVRDSNIVHESAKELYRKPLGAVKVGSEISIALSVFDISVDSVELMVVNGNQSAYRLIFDGEMYRTSFVAPHEMTVLWYWFRIKFSGGAVIYYGTEPGDNSGIGRVFSNTPPAFQITVYDASFRTPNWAKGAILYQIFPDRLRRGNEETAKGGLAYHHEKGRTNMHLHERWDELPDWKPVEGKSHYEPVDFFGGDIQGIREELPRLVQLGVKVIYLNPIFEADSNHRYNTADYLKIDPMLGTIDDFYELVKDAKALGIRILLDGVFSHTGDDSIYFNRYERYETVGAYQSQSSPYYSWYRFHKFPNEYDCWWGFDTLPEVNEDNPFWNEFMIEGEESVFRTWMQRGVAGYRLDVADELPDATIEKMRAVMKSINPDSFLLGEVWEDATTKQSYNIGRSYALGRGLDSVMNYPFSVRTTEFLLGKIDAFTYRRFLVSQNQNYPKEMVYSLMNLLSSHDSARIRSVLATGENGRTLSREKQAQFELTESAEAQGAALQRLAVAIQFSIPGMPSIYYGDEVGMTGLLDPFNRMPFSVCDTKMQDWHIFLSGLRATYPVLRSGHVIFYSTNGNVLGILRYNLGGEDAFGSLAEEQVLLTLVNPTNETHHIVIDLFAVKDCQETRHRQMFCEMNWTKAKSLTTGSVIQIHEGLLDVEMPPTETDIFELIWG
ncbi:MAG: glycoside hydrolase family 13 protein [Clostridiales Family XIII bacterium]|nr:glycoside hydrolase family 13 protein [Clostridiales Family XIII bacterium]